MSSDAVATHRRIPRLLRGMPRNVVILGFVSFLADISGEMVYPLIPLFLTAVLGAPVSVVGLIEGLAEGTAAFLRLGGGWWSDRVGRRMPLVVTGYGLAALGKVLLALAFVWPVVLAARLVDRFGKGIRSSPRDALIADSAPLESRGRAFGLHRSMDTAGAVIGPLLGLALVAVLSDRMRLVFAIAAIPATLSVVALALVREPARTSTKAAAPRPAMFTLDVFRGAGVGRLRLFILAALVFALGNSSDVFIILRAKDLGLSTTAIVLAYVLYNTVYTALAMPLGALSDRVPRSLIMIAGLVVFAAVYAGFAVVDDATYVWPLMALYGCYIAATDGIARAMVVDLVAPERRATALGWHGLVLGLGAVVSSLAAGILWDSVGSAAPFTLGAATALAAAAILTLSAKRAVRG